MSSHLSEPISASARDSQRQGPSDTSAAPESGAGEGPKPGYFSTAWSLLRQTWTEFGSDHGFRLAAALSYYTVFALPPLLIVLMGIAGLLWDPSDVQARLMQEFGGVVGARGADEIRVMIESTGSDRQSLIGSLIGVCVLLAGATGVMLQLQDALNQIWNVKPAPDDSGLFRLVTKRLLSLGMILAIAFLLIVSLLATTLLHGFSGVIGRHLPDGFTAAGVAVLNWTISFVGIWGLFSLLFRFLPDRRIAWRDVLLGGAITAVLFNIAKLGLGIYLANSDVAGAFGSAGSLVLILMWIYYSGVVFLLGAEFTQVWTRRRLDGALPAKE